MVAREGAPATVEKDVAEPVSELLAGLRVDVRRVTAVVPNRAGSSASRSARCPSTWPGPSRRHEPRGARPAGVSAALADPRRAPARLPRRRLDHPEAAPGHRRGSRLLRDVHRQRAPRRASPRRDRHAEVRGRAPRGREPPRRLAERDRLRPGHDRGHQLARARARARRRRRGRLSGERAPRELPAVARVRAKPVVMPIDPDGVCRGGRSSTGSSVLARGSSRSPTCPT